MDSAPIYVITPLKRTQITKPYGNPAFVGTVKTENEDRNCAYIGIRRLFITLPHKRAKTKTVKNVDLFTGEAGNSDNNGRKRRRRILLFYYCLKSTGEARRKIPMRTYWGKQKTKTKRPKT